MATVQSRARSRAHWAQSLALPHLNNASLTELPDLSELEVLLLKSEGDNASPTEIF